MEVGKERKIVMSVQIDRESAGIYPGADYGRQGIERFLGTLVDALHDVVARGGQLSIRADATRIRAQQFAPDDNAFLDYSDRRNDPIAALAPSLEPQANGAPAPQALVEAKKQVLGQLFGGQAKVIGGAKPVPRVEIPDDIRASQAAHVAKVLGTQAPEPMPEPEPAPEPVIRPVIPGKNRQNLTDAERADYKRQQYLKRRAQGLYYASEMYKGKPPAWGKKLIPKKGRDGHPYFGNGNELRSMPDELKGVPLRDIPVSNSPVPTKVANLIMRYDASMTLGDLDARSDKQLGLIPGMNPARRELVRAAINLASAR